MPPISKNSATTADKNGTAPSLLHCDNHDPHNNDDDDQCARLSRMDHGARVHHVRVERLHGFFKMAVHQSARRAALLDIVSERSADHQHDHQ